tara:strand:+ start:228 stop:425 length:198 start_codon:yes stop_codon:yes gene_type:complete
MAANTIIHSVDTNNSECIVTMYDDGDLVLDRINIGVTNNTELVNVLKNRLAIHRNEKKLKEAKIV